MRALRFCIPIFLCLPRLLLAAERTTANPTCVPIAANLAAHRKIALQFVESASLSFPKLSADSPLHVSCSVLLHATGQIYAFREGKHFEYIGSPKFSPFMLSLLSWLGSSLRLKNPKTAAAYHQFACGSRTRTFRDCGTKNGYVREFVQTMFFKAVAHHAVQAAKTLKRKEQHAKFAWGAFLFAFARDQALDFKPSDSYQKVLVKAKSLPVKAIAIKGIQLPASSSECVLFFVHTLLNTLRQNTDIATRYEVTCGHAQRMSNTREAWEYVYTMAADAQHDPDGCPICEAL